MALASFQSHEIEENWYQIQPFVKRVLNKIDLWYTLDNIKDSLCNAEMQLWTSYIETQLKSVCVTRIVIHPKNYKFLEIVLMAGEMISVPELQQIEGWAKDDGCIKSRLTGRRGWKKALPDYKEKQIILEKRL